MIIGIDVDGVLVDMASYQLDHAIPYFKKRYNMEAKHPKAYDVEDIFECTKEQRDRFWTKYIWGYCVRTNMTKGAAETVRKLRAQGHQIYVITGRVFTINSGIRGKVFRGMIKYWLWKNKFKYDRIFFVSEKESATGKFDVCKREKVEILVDDKPENLFALKDEIKVFCYPAIWNEDIRELDQYRINDFRELTKLIK